MKPISIDAVRQSPLPDSATLADRMTAALPGVADASRPVTILRRELPSITSTFPNEIVTCSLSNGRRRRVFVKYKAGQSHASYGHRGDVPYEAEVYRRVLQGLPDFRPKYLGAHTDPKTGDASLFLEYVDRNVRLSDIRWKFAMRQPRALDRAARWLGRFHLDQEARVHDPALSFLKRYDAEYFRGWAERTSEFARPLYRRFPWLAGIRDWGDAWFAPLLAAKPTMIHGEFYTKTILMRAQSLFIVDWESAAIAAGEIDLAALTEGNGWRRQRVRRWEDQYKRSRWPEGLPDAFQGTLDAARVYLHLRWLGDRPDWSVREKSLWRYDHLHATAQRLGLMPSASPPARRAGNPPPAAGPLFTRSAARRSDPGARLCARDRSQRRSRPSR